MVTDKAASTSAKRIRRSQGSLVAPWQMMVTCDQCGEQFAFLHSLEAEGVALATRQAKSLAEILTWDHIQEQRHKASITIPVR